jgi:starch-binding outer membrane protein, SusD/RagB family
MHPRVRPALTAAALLLVAACDPGRETGRPLPTGVSSAPRSVSELRATQIIPAPLGPDGGFATSGSGAPPSALSNIVAVGSGSNTSCALRNDGLVFCWGSNQSGMFGNGSLAGSATAVETSGPQRFTALAVGDANACGLTAAGEAFCWGDNANGQIGVGTTGVPVLVPTAVGGGHTWRSLSIGLRTICGIATTGVTYCWGNNQFGQAGIGGVSASVPTPTAVVNSGTLGFGNVQAGFFASCATTAASGAVYCWGASGPYFGNGVIDPASSVPVPAASNRSLVQLDGGTLYSCGLNGGGRAVCWGAQAAGELGNGGFVSPVLSPTLVSGQIRFRTLDAHSMNSFLAFSCGLSTANEAWCWGTNDVGQLGATGASTCTFGSLTFNCSAVPLKVGGGRSFVDLAVGLRHSCAMDAAGRVFCWGDNAFGQLGDGSRTSSTTPVQVVRLGAPPQNGSAVVTPLSSVLNLLGATVQLTATALDENGTPLAVQPLFRWLSSNPSVATVDANGLVTSVANGSATITARTAPGLMGGALLSVQALDPADAFRRAWSGSGTSSSSSDGLVMLGGILGDEWRHADTFLGRLQIDTRSINPATNGELGMLFNSIRYARTVAEHEEQRLIGITPTNPRIGEFRAYAGYVYLGLAEAFCSGVPLDDPNTGLTTAELLTLAETRFTQALAGPIAPPHDGLARVGLARARLGAGNYSGAAAEAALVPPSFTFATSHSPALGFENWVYSLTTLQRRYSVTDLEGTNGLPFRGAADPRVPWIASGFGFDGFTPVFVQQKYLSIADPIVIASATEARLIEAEAALRSGNATALISGLNALRAAIALPPLVDPGTQVGRENVLFSERAFWLFATGTRLGDLRRLIGQYGRTESAVFPVGPYHKGGTYGSDANLPVPTSARGPSYAGCIDRTT